MTKSDENTHYYRYLEDIEMNQIIRDCVKSRRANLKRQKEKKKKIRTDMPKFLH